MNPLKALLRGLLTTLAHPGPLLLHAILLGACGLLLVAPLLALLPELAHSGQLQVFDPPIEADVLASFQRAYPGQMASLVWLAPPLLLVLALGSGVLRCAAMLQYSQKERLGWSAFLAQGFRFLPAFLLMSLAHLAFIAAALLLYSVTLVPLSTWMHERVQQAWLLATLPWLHALYLLLCVWLLLASRRAAVAHLVQSGRADVFTGLSALLRGLFWTLRHPLGSALALALPALLGWGCVFCLPLLKGFGVEAKSWWMLLLLGQGLLLLRVLFSYWGWASFACWLREPQERQKAPQAPVHPPLMPPEAM
jgi:hypothetical protein